MSDDKFEEFVNRLETKYPEMFSAPYGGVCTSEGWWPIIESLCEQIQSHINWRNGVHERLKVDNPHDAVIPDKVPQVVVNQIKEKFGGLRFYYDGGDDIIDGMVQMAEAWAAHTCEVCGMPGKSRPGGWIQTLCDEHHEEREDRKRSLANRTNI